MNFLLKEGKTNWKYIIIVVILAAVIGGGILWFSTKQEVFIKFPEVEFPEIKKPEKVVEDETANWKIYQNMDYGYEIKYPAISLGGETGNGIRIKNLPIVEKESGIQEKSLDIYLSDNVLEENCQRIISEAVENIFTKINDKKVLVQRWRVIAAGGEPNPNYYWTVVQANTNIRKNQCVAFELVFKYPNYPERLPSIKNEGETSILYQVVSTLSTFEPQERFVKVLFPNGGEQLVLGNTYSITWNAKNVKKIDILLAERKGEDRTYATERLIVNDFILTGENKYEWNIPADLPPSKYVLLISSDDKQKWVKDFSDNYFTISGALSIQEKEKMLREMFKGEFTIEGNEIIVSSALKPYRHFYLEKIVEGSFVTPYAKEYLFILQLSGVAHAGGLTHSFLGVFDENKALSSPSVDIDSVMDFSSEVHFGGDFVDFNFYSCKGITCVFVTSGGCPNGGVCSNSENSLLKVENGKFKVLQDVFKTILDMKGYKGGPWPEFRIKIEKDKILVYDWKLVDYNFNCIAPNCIGEDEFGAGLRDDKKMMRLIYSGQLFWDNNDCKFVEKLE